MGHNFVLSCLAIHRSFFAKGVFATAVRLGNFWIAGATQVVIKTLATLENGFSDGNHFGTSVAMGNFLIRCLASVALVGQNGSRKHQEAFLWNRTLVLANDRGAGFGGACSRSTKTANWERDETDRTSPALWGKVPNTK